MALPGAGIEQAFVNSRLIMGFVEIMEEDHFLGSFSVRALKCKEFLERFPFAYIPAAGEIFTVLADKDDRRLQSKSKMAKQLKTSMFNKFNDQVLRELGTEQKCQILRMSVAVQTYGLKDK